jgi:hypothetical protein
MSQTQESMVSSKWRKFSVDTWAVLLALLLAALVRGGLFKHVPW